MAGDRLDPKRFALPPHAPALGQSDQEHKPRTLTAEARIVHRGRTTIVVEVKVRDQEGKLIASLVATQLVPTASDRR